MLFRICSRFVFVLILAGAAMAQPPATINIHGAVAAPSGEPLSGDRVYEIQFFDAASGGSPLGTAFTGTTTVSPSGVFNIPITPPVEIFAAAEVWYEIAIDTDEPVDVDASDDVFVGRVAVQSVPFALSAGEAAHVDAANVGSGAISSAELDALDGVTGNLQSQLNTLSTSTGASSADIADLEAEQLSQNIAIAAKAAAVDVYTKAEVDGQQAAQDTAIAAKANAADVYTKAEVDTSQGAQDSDIAALETEQDAQDAAIALKADAADVYSKVEVDGQQGAQDTTIAGKADAANVYTKGEIDTQQGAQDSGIAALETEQDAQDAAIALKANAADVYTKTDIDNQQLGQDNDIDALETSQGTQDAAIALKANAADVYTKTDIDNQQLGQDNDIDALETSQGTQDAAIALKANAADVYTKTDIDNQQLGQDTDIAALESSQATQDTDIAALESSQATQDTDIAALESSQATQDTDIAALESSQATQDTDIAALESSQATQDTAIAAKADAADVYTKTESDTAFVDVAGDTVTGALAISDSTASTSDTTGALTVTGGAGVAGDLNIGGEASADAMTIASAGSPPGVTTNKLYNVGGALFFAGSQISGGGPLGSSIESSEITDGAIVDTDINASADISASKLAASVVVSGEGNAQLTNDAGYLTAVTSSVITNDTILDADINSSANISASKLSSTVVVSGEGNAQLTNDAGYLTAEADTLSAVTGRGASTSTQLTLNAGVKTDTVSEVTSANGVSVDGVKMKDSFVELTSISAPSPTTNRLYNEGGTLKFNGTALGGGGGTQYTFLNWHYTTFTTLIFANRDAFTAVMPMAGTITGVQVYCRQDSSVVGTWDVRINGTSVFGGAQDAPTSFDDNVRKSVTVTNGSFSAGATISLWGNFTSGQVNQPMVFVTITY